MCIRDSVSHQGRTGLHQYLWRGRRRRAAVRRIQEERVRARKGTRVAGKLYAGQERLHQVRLKTRETSMDEHSATRRMLLACGIAVPLLYAVADLVAGVQWKGYSFRDQTISELGAIGAPSRTLFSVLLVVVYALMVAFGVGAVSYTHLRA